MTIRMIFCGVLLGTLLHLASKAGLATAQDSVLAPIAVPISTSAEQGSSPALVADPSGTVHAFWSSRRAADESEAKVIFYSQYRGGAWSEPVDILMSPNGEDALFPRVALDAGGCLHLVWSAPDAGPFGPLYHSWATVEDASSFYGWQPPVLLAEGTFQSDIKIDSQGRLHIVYASVSDGRGICHTWSADNGDQWEMPSCIASAYALRDDEHEVKPRLAIDSQDTLHVVWVLDDYSPASQLAYSGRAVYYARSNNGGVDWSEPLTIDEIDGRGGYDRQVDGFQPEWGNIIVDHADRVHIVWVGRPDMQRYHQWSADGGLTWSDRQVAIPAGGYNNWQGLAVDAAGTLHLAWPSLQGMQVTSWDGSQWAPPVRIENAGSAHYAQSAVALGNQLHVLWQNHGGSLALGEPGLIMHALIETGASSISPVPVPTVGQRATAISIPSPRTSPMSTVSPPIETESTIVGAPAPAYGTPSPLLIGLAPALLLIAIVLLVCIRQRR